MPYGRRGQHRRSAPARSGKLREVVERFTISTFNPETFRDDLPTSLERLVCGHIIRPPKDFKGETLSDRRRCSKCSDEKPADDLNTIWEQYQYNRHSAYYDKKGTKPKA